MTTLAARLATLAVPPPPDLDLAGPAADAGLLDVAVATADTDVGPLLLATTPRGLVRLAFLDVEDESRVLTSLARRLSPRIVRAPSRLGPILARVESYLAGARGTIDVEVDLSLATPFGRAVLEAAGRIPRGRVATYRELAAEVGRPTAARAVGNALGANPVPIVVPCHRVVRTGGGLGGYVGGLPVKSRLLQLERAA